MNVETVEITKVELNYLKEQRKTMDRIKTWVERSKKKVISTDMALYYIEQVIESHDEMEELYITRVNELLDADA